jgi:hypothetical protein
MVQLVLRFRDDDHQSTRLSRGAGCACLISVAVVRLAMVPGLLLSHTQAHLSAADRATTAAPSPNPPAK